MQHVGPGLGHGYNGLLGQQHSKQCSCTLQCISHYVNVSLAVAGLVCVYHAKLFSNESSESFLGTRNIMIVRACLCVIGVQIQKCLGTHTKLSTLGACLSTSTRLGMGTQILKCNLNLNQQNLTQRFCTVQCITHHHDRCCGCRSFVSQACHQHIS